MKRDLACQLRLALKTSNVIGIASDHGGHELKAYLTTRLREAGAKVIDFGNPHLDPNDDYPSFVVPLAQAVAAGKVGRGVAICGSGVGACIVANKVAGVRACLIHDHFSAHQGVEDDDLNMICLGGLVVGHALAWELLMTFLTAEFSGKERHRRRLGKVMELENRSPPKVIAPADHAVDVEPPEVPNAPLRVFFIRHGETEWTFTGQHTGLTDIPLTALGEDEVRGWGQRLADLPFAHVLTSPLQRAQRTCELIGLAKDAQIEPDLAEWDYGDYEGIRSADIYKDRPGWNVFRDGCPNGESPDEISARADRLIDRLRTMQGNIALFSHGQFGGVLAARWLRLSIVEAQHFTLGTASLSILSNNPHHPEVPVIELWNALPHGVSSSASAPHPHHQMSMRKNAFQQWENEGGKTSGVNPNEFL